VSFTEQLLDDRTRTDRLLHQWQQRTIVAIFAYNRAASRCRMLDTLLGGIAATLAAAIGTAVFATLEQQVGTAARIFAGTLSVAAAILAGVQTFATLPKRVEEYEQAGRRFGSLRREIELLRLTLPETPAGMAQAVEEIRRRLDLAAQSSPNAPRRLWERTREQVKGEYGYGYRIRRRLRGLPPARPLGLGGVLDDGGVLERR